MSLPESPNTLADLLPHLPLPHAYAVRWALVFDAALAERLAEVQAEQPTQHYARPTLMTTGSYLLGGDLLSEVAAGGLYVAGFAKLDASRFNEIAVMPWADAVALLPQPEGDPV